MSSIKLILLTLLIIFASAQANETSSSRTGKYNFSKKTQQNFMHGCTSRLTPQECNCMLEFTRQHFDERLNHPPSADFQKDYSIRPKTYTDGAMVECIDDNRIEKTWTEKDFVFIGNLLYAIKKEEIKELQFTEKDYQDFMRQCTNMESPDMCNCISQKILAYVNEQINNPLEAYIRENENISPKAYADIAYAQCAEYLSNKPQELRDLENHDAPWAYDSTAWKEETDAIKGTSNFLKFIEKTIHILKSQNPQKGKKR